MKKIKGIFKNKLALLLVGALLLGFGGTVLYLSQTNKTKKEEAKKDENVTNKNEKGEGLETSETTSTTKAVVSEKPPTDTGSLGSLATSVTAQKSVSDDSISILFYLEDSGAFTVQEKVGGVWQTTIENTNYSGRGGLTVGTLASGQNSKTLRVMKIENGKYSAATKEFTVNRAEVISAGGIKTYN